MKTIMTSGTFDLLHYGHMRLLRRAKALGDYLIVELSTDEFCVSKKNKHTFYDYETRKEMLESLEFVDLVVPEQDYNAKFANFQKYHVDTYVIGSDYKDNQLLKEIPKYCQLVILDRTEGISTSQIKKMLGKEFKK